MFGNNFFYMILALSKKIFLSWTQFLTNLISHNFVKTCWIMLKFGIHDTNIFSDQKKLFFSFLTVNYPIYRKELDGHNDILSELTPKILKILTKFSIFKLYYSVLECSNRILTHCNMVFRFLYILGSFNLALIIQKICYFF